MCPRCGGDLNYDGQCYRCGWDAWRDEKFQEQLWMACTSADDEKKEEGIECPGYLVPSYVY